MKQILFSIIIVMSLQVSLYAQVYKTTDSNGKVTYSDKPTKESEEIKLDRPNVTKSIDIVDQTWNQLQRNSTAMSFHFSVIPVNDAFELIADYAEKMDGITVSYEFNHLANISVKYIRIPWAQVIQGISSEYKLELRYANGTVVISDSTYE